MSGDNQNNDNTTDDSTGSDSTGNDDKSTHSDNQDTGNASGSDNNDASGDDKGTKTTNDVVSKADYDALFKRMQAADRAKVAAEKKLSDADKAKLSDIERAQVEAKESRERAEKAEAQLRHEKIFNAFLSHKDVTWHDVNDAFTMFKNSYMDGVDIADDKVTGIDPAVKKMVKEKAYLVKPAIEGDGGTGAPHNGRRAGEQNDTGKAARIARFPAAYGPR